MKKNNYRFTLAAVMLSVGAVLTFLAATDFSLPVKPALSPTALVKADADDFVDHTVGRTMEIFDESGALITKMASNVGVGDQVIKPDGRHYEVKKVDGSRATAKLLGADKEYLAWVDYFNNLTEVPVATKEWKDRPVAIYQTHTDESYVPTEGTESKPFNGGILEVGKHFAEGLKNKGLNVIYNDNKHDPHDNNAYMRSRRTATELMKQNPIAMFDVHRDGIPDPSYYSENISGRDVAQLRLVVGKQNPKMSSNMDFAKRLMAYANKEHPGIIKEIFVGKGNYNQDLMSTALLIEAGTHTNPRELAEEGIALLADAVPVVLGATGGPTPGGPGAETGSDAGARGGWKTVAWILGALLLGGGAFLLISTGSFKGAVEKLGGIGKEMTGFLAPARKKEIKVGQKRSLQDKIDDEDTRDEIRND